MRSQFEDQLVDHMVAAEGVFLKAQQDELSYKLAVRCAGFIDLPPHAPSAVFDFMKIAYGLRSRIVHGESAQTMKVLDGTDTSLLGQVVNDLESVLQAVLLESIVQVSMGDNLDTWDHQLGQILDRGLETSTSIEAVET